MCRTKPPKAGFRSEGQHFGDRGYGLFRSPSGKELLDAGERSLLCLVRGGSQERLWETLSGYFGAGWVEGCKDRVKAFGETLPRIDWACRRMRIRA